MKCDNSDTNPGRKHSRIFSSEKKEPPSIFEKYLEETPGLPYVEMGTVKGVREQGKRMLTMIFTQADLMLLFIMPDKTGDSVVDVFDWLTSALGLEIFLALFPAILTDNGGKFKRVRDLEQT